MKFNQRLNEGDDHKFEFRRLKSRVNEDEIFKENNQILPRLDLMNIHALNIDYNFVQQIHIDHFVQLLK
jgi:hypothetical protein